MKHNPKVSVVVPVFNVAPYLSECLESIASQSESDFEVILVNDGSTDGGDMIASEFCKVDSRFRMITIEHSGLGAARNRGIEGSHGEFVAFIDSDDGVHRRYLEVLLSGFSDAGTGISMVGIERCSEVAKRDTDISINFRTINGYDALEGMLYQSDMFASSCGKMFRRELLNQYRFSETLLYEDLDFMSKILPATERVSVTDAPMYLYRQRGGSIINTFSMKRLDVLTVTEEILKRVECEFPQLIKAARDRRMSAAFNMLILLSKNGFSETEEAELCRAIIKDMRPGSLLNPKVRLKNKLGVLLSYFGMSAVTFVGRHL